MLTLTLTSTVVPSTRLGCSSSSSLTAWVVVDGCFVGNTISGGTFSPNVRASFAMRLRLISASLGMAGMVGVTGVGTPRSARRVEDVLLGCGDMGNGTRTSVRSTGTVFKRRTRGRGASAERRGREEKPFGIGNASREEDDELADAEVYRSRAFFMGEGNG